MRKAYFCYEKDFASRWCPVIYYDEVMTKSANGKEAIPDRSPIYTLPDEYIEGDEVNVSFNTLQKLYPPPLTKVETEPKLIIEYTTTTETVVERGENAKWSDLSKDS